MPASGEGAAALDGAPMSPLAVPAAALEPWRELVGVLAQHLALLRATHVPRILIRCLFKQVRGLRLLGRYASCRLACLALM